MNGWFFLYFQIFFITGKLIKLTFLHNEKYLLFLSCIIKCLLSRLSLIHLEGPSLATYHYSIYHWGIHVERYYYNNFVLFVSCTSCVTCFKERPWPQHVFCYRYGEGLPRGQPGRVSEKRSQQFEQQLPHWPGSARAGLPTADHAGEYTIKFLTFRMSARWIRNYNAIGNANLLTCHLAE